MNTLFKAIYYRTSKPNKLLILVSLICLILNIVSFHQTTEYIKETNRMYMRDLINYTNGYIKNTVGYDGLKQCLMTKTPNKQYTIVQEFIDRMLTVEAHLDYIYIITIDKKDPKVINIMSAMTEQDKQLGPVPEFPIGYTSDDDKVSKYSKETIMDLYDIQYNNEHGQIRFIETITGWGEDYTGAIPLYDSNNQPFALLCIDVPIKYIRTMIRKNMIVSVLIFILIISMIILLITQQMMVNVYKMVNEVNEINKEKEVLRDGSGSDNNRTNSQ